MGTLQLLLVVTGVIIVGIAVFIGVSIFGTNGEQAKKDALTQDCLRIASAAQSYYNKPAMLGGGNNSFNNISITHCGMMEDASSLESSNVNGKYEITLAKEHLFEISGACERNPKNRVVVSVDMTRRSNDDRVLVEYDGW